MTEPLLETSEVRALTESEADEVSGGTTLAISQTLIQKPVITEAMITNADVSGYFVPRIKVN